MQIYNDLAVTSFDRVQAGELIVFQYAGAYALALVVRRLDDDEVVLGILQAEAEAELKPFHLKVSLDGFCLTYGDGWEIELAPTLETFPNNSKFWDTPGVVHISSDRVTVAFGKHPREIMSGRLHFDLKTNTLSSSLPNHAAPVTSWRIWSRAHHRLEQGAEPVFAFKVT